MAAGRFIARCGEAEREVELTASGEAIVEGVAKLALRVIAPGEFVVANGDRSVRAFAAGPADAYEVFVEGRVYRFAVSEENQRRRGSAVSNADLLAAPMPGTVVKVLVQPGERVQRGDVLIKLEAMKMEMPIRAPHDGSVTAVHCREGELVQAGTRLLDLADSAEAGSSRP